MSGYRRVNYYELCRLCTSNEGTKMNIFREEGRRRQLQTKIQTCLPIQVRLDIFFSIEEDLEKLYYKIISWIFLIMLILYLII